jgi:peroxiredoxin Q/BCP
MTGGNDFTLAKLKGQRTVLYFYPRDNTPGCTKEGIAFAENYKKFRSLGVEIYGVSGDTLAKHEKFREKYGFPFPLVSDPDETLCEKFGVMKMKTLYGKKFRGIERSTFVLDEKGKIEKEWRGVKVDGHVQEVLSYLRDE